mgnify:FL=1
MTTTTLKKRHFSNYREALAPLPDLVAAQTASYQWLMKEGLNELFKEFSPLKD